MPHNLPDGSFNDDQRPQAATRFATPWNTRTGQYFWNWGNAKLIIDFCMRCGKHLCSNLIWKMYLFVDYLFVLICGFITNLFVILFVFVGKGILWKGEVKMSDCC